MIKNRFYLYWWWVRDYVLFANRKKISMVLAVTAHLLLAINVRSLAFKILFFADRFGGNFYTRLLIKSNLDAVIAYSESYIGSRRSDDIEWVKKRCLVLKSPELSEGITTSKGCILVKFTSTFSCLFRSLECQRLLNDYVLVFEPSWAGYALPEIFVWLKFYDSHIIIQASDYRDRRLLTEIERNVHPISIGSSDWVDDEVFFPITGEKKIYDVIFVANYSSGKRHYVLFNVLDKLRRKGVDLRVAMVCAKWGMEREVIIDLVKRYSLDNCLDIFEQLTQSEINLLFNRSKVNILLSLKEGSNRSLFEGMFANVPAVLLSENVGVNHSYINKYTGVVVPERNLSETLIQLKNNWNKFSPREWAMNNISAYMSTRKLESKIKEIGAEIGGDLAVKVNKPEACYKDGRKEFFGDIEDVLQKYASNGPIAITIGI